ncbi:nucleoside hydrolase [Bacillus hominis]|uniref:Nucleoside hydrolase n=1 Tax=Bacillus hominis TaxID=2817478 RepID=A0ABT7RE47_9BACI|nr:nucleoside hydrolase [Bacillus hominis]MDM5196096.1 nucleoside hydrolase [Bacillus hominis]MDM5435756.1 nucleoside hydrolase [Bacillus hominis]MDM5441204.1 nucleoside hydrolase [Bacillus hominis]
MSKKVLIFCDPGIDDTIALLLAFCIDEIEVVGIVADYGNVPKEMAVQNAHFLKQKSRNRDIKIFGGSERPLNGGPPAFFTNIHGKEGLGPIIPNEKLQNGEMENFFEVIPLIEQYKDELIIVSLGRLTSLAILFILCKNLMQQIQSYYVMGGAFLHPGNVTPVSEANFYGDPIAANIVLQSASNMYIYPLNVTQYSIVTPDMAEYIEKKGKAPLVKPLFDHYYYGYYKNALPHLKGCPFHDTIPILALFDSSMFTYHKSPIVVMTESYAQGESIGDFRSLVGSSSFTNWPAQQIAIDFDYNFFFKYFMSLMTDESF